MEELTIPSNAKLLDGPAITYNNKVKKITFPEGLTRIFNCAVFRDVVTEIHFPSTLTSFLYKRDGLENKFIGYYDYTPASSSVKELCIIIDALDPPTFSSEYINIANIAVKIYVPQESVEKYKAARIWSLQAARIFPMSEYQG